MDVNEIFRLRLEAEMKAQGLNPASLSKRANMNRRAVNDLLEGRSRSPKLSTAYSLAHALSVTLDMLTGDAPQKAIAPSLLALLARYDQDEQEQLAEAILRLPPAPEQEQSKLEPSETRSPPLLPSPPSNAPPTRKNTTGTSD